MKKIFTFSLALLLSATLTFAQTAPDFTYTDTNGDSHSLYETLDEGKVVLLDFFFVACPPCQQWAPEIESLIEDYQGTTLEIWAISDRDANAAIEASMFASSHPNHFAGGSEGQGNEAVGTFSSNFNFTGFPTYAVVCSDKSITWDVWPITAGTQEIRQHLTEECGVTELVSGVSTISSMSVARMTPNPVSDFANLEFALSQNTDITINVVNALGQVVKTIASQEYTSGSHTVAIDADDLANGIYFARMSSVTGVNTVEFVVSGK